jgi:uncharacterized protein (DUF2384 family)
MVSCTQPSECSDLILVRLNKKKSDVIQAFDREIARRNALRQKLIEIDAVLLLAAIDCFGSSEAAALWLTSPDVGLANENPLDVAATDEGKERVLRLLWRLDLSMFACPAAD